MPDVTLDGFGNTGWFQFQTPVTAAIPNANNARLIKRIRGSRSGVDILGIDGFVIWTGTEPLSNLFGGMCPFSAVEVIRSSVQASTLPVGFDVLNPGGSTPVIQYPGGFESLWMGYMSGPAVSTAVGAATNPGWNAGPNPPNSFRFPPGTLHAFEDKQLWVVMYGAMNFASGTNFPSISQLVNHLRCLSVIGIDYGSDGQSVGNVPGGRSYPRSGGLIQGQ